MADADDVAAQLERPLRAAVDVVARCHLGVPVVVAVPPLLDDGTPFPTRYWLTCPLARTRIGRLEAAGGVKRMDAKVAGDPVFGAEMASRHVSYAIERDALVPEDASRRPQGGVGGSRAGVKCLHAHYADYAAGNSNPIGGLVAGWVEPLNCPSPCVTDGARRSDWVEPS